MVVKQLIAELLKLDQELVVVNENGEQIHYVEEDNGEVILS